MKNTQDIVYTKPVHTISSVRIATVQDGPDIVLPYISVFRSLTLSYTIPSRLTYFDSARSDYPRSVRAQSTPTSLNSSVSVHPFSHCRPKITGKPQTHGHSSPIPPPFGFSTFAPRARFKTGAILPYRPPVGSLALDTCNGYLATRCTTRIKCQNTPLNRLFKPR